MWLILKINTTLGELVVLHAVQHYPALCAVSIKVNASDKQSALCHAVFYSLFCTALFLLPMSVCVCQTPSIGLWHPSFYHCLFSYAIGSRKLLANEQFFCWCSNSSKFVTNNSNKTRCVIYSHQQSLHLRKQNHNCLNRDGTLFYFLPGVDVSCVYVHAWVLSCLYSHISTQTFQRVLTASMDSCTEIESAPSVA